MAKVAPVMKIDEEEFIKAVKRYQKATQKGTSVILNHWATQAAFRAGQGKYSARAKKIPKAPKVKGGPRALTRKGRMRKASGKTFQNYKDSLWFALAMKLHKKRGREPWYAGALSLYESRKRSVGFIQANWGATVGKLGIKRTTKFVREPEIKVKKATRYSLDVSLYNAILQGKGVGKAKSKLNPKWSRAQYDAIYGKNGMIPYANKKIKANWKRAGKRIGSGVISVAKGI